MLVDKLELKNVVIPCERCGVQHAGDVRGSFNLSDDDTYNQSGTLHFLVKCPGCDSPFLASVNWVWAGEGYALDPPMVLYPDDGGRFDDSVPASIANSYAEAAKALRAAAPTATAIMCRRTLEGICQHFGASGKNMPQKLDDLRIKGELDPRLHEWANDLRILGNDAAHDVDTVIAQDDARDALEFTKALIQNLFVLRRAFEEFKKRRASAQEDEQPDPF